MLTSFNQGQIFGANPSLEELECQLAADPTTKAGTKMWMAVATFGSRVSMAKDSKKTLPRAEIRKAILHVA